MNKSIIIAVIAGVVVACAAQTPAPAAPAGDTGAPSASAAGGASCPPPAPARKDLVGHQGPSFYKVGGACCSYAELEVPTEAAGGPAFADAACTVRATPSNTPQ